MAYAVVKLSSCQSASCHDNDCRVATVLAVSTVTKTVLGWQYAVLTTMVLLVSPKCSLWWPRYFMPRRVSKSCASSCTSCSAGETMHTESLSPSLKNVITTFDLQVDVSEVHAGVQTQALNNASGHVMDTTADGACSIHAVFGSCIVRNAKLYCESPRKVIRSAFHKSLSTIREQLSSSDATTKALEHIE